MKIKYAPVILSFLLITAFQNSSANSDQSSTREVLSKVYEVKDIYRSMRGPYSIQEILLLESEEPELLWITGYKAVMKAADGKTPMSQEFMCHSNLDLDMKNHRTLFGWEKYPSRRLFTLSQGQLEIEFPHGFGIPVLSNEPLSLATQILNLNDGNLNKQVRHDVTISFVRDKDLAKPMKPLFMSAANGLVLVEGKDGYYDVEKSEPAVHGPGCLIGENEAGNIRTDKFGRKFSGHWKVKPGRQVNHTLVTNWMVLPFDTSVHYIAVHLHPFSESLELRDITADQTIFKSNVKASTGRMGIDRVDYFSSEKGIPLYKDHEYELISIYNNTSGIDQDSMAVMYLYLLDQEYHIPDILKK